MEGWGVCCGQGLGSKPNIRAGAGLGEGWVRRSVLCGVVVERRGRLICLAEGLSLPAAQLTAACLAPSWDASGRSARRDCTACPVALVVPKYLTSTFAAAGILTCRKARRKDARHESDG